jgi:acetyl esterase/lipase
MPSFKSRLFVFVLKFKHLLKGKLKRTDSIDRNTSIPKLREEIEKGAEFWGKLPHGFSLESIKIGELDAEWMIPPGAGRDKVILYFHGGGLVVGSIKAHRGIVSKFVEGTGFSALIFDYALAPEHPFPAGLNDCLAAYHYLLAEGTEPTNIVFMGDSGGGNLVFTSLLALKERGAPLPAATVALSPWTDLTNSGESWETNAKHDSLTWKSSQTIFSDYYVGEHHATNPLISPLFGDLTGLPPISIYAGGHESMLSDSTRFAEKAQAAGVDVKLTIGEGLFHCYPACAPLFPEATEAKDEICDFIRECLS